MLCVTGWSTTIVSELMRMLPGEQVVRVRTGETDEEAI